MKNQFQKAAGIYRSRGGMILGVCRGLAEYADVSVFWVRAITVAMLIFTGFWPVGGLYLVAAFLMKPEPVLPIHTEGEQDFYNSYANSRTIALHRLRRTFDQLDRRIHRMEDRVTNRQYDWERRLRTEK
jgi:phage shock protein C